MKSIILFRHCMSIEKLDCDDHSRKLTSGGIFDAKKMGKYLHKIKMVPNLVISSTAVRAQTTANTAIISGGWDSFFSTESKIYKGDARYLLDFIKSQKERHKLICIVGHEPHLSDYIKLATKKYCNHFAPGSMAKIDYNIKVWTDISINIGFIDWIIHPKEII